MVTLLAARSIPQPLLSMPQAVAPLEAPIFLKGKPVSSRQVHNSPVVISLSYTDITGECRSSVELNQYKNTYSNNDGLGRHVLYRRPFLFILPKQTYVMTPRIRGAIVH